MSGIPHVQAFRSWLKQEVAALDWKLVKPAGGLGRHVQPRQQLQHSPGLQMSSKRSSSPLRSAGES